jgi:hypothetical protein
MVTAPLVLEPLEIVLVFKTKSPTTTSVKPVSVVDMLVLVHLNLRYLVVYS